MTPDTPTLLAAHDAALAGVGRIVAGIDADQLSAPTPCPDFDIDALLGHVVGGNHRFAAVARGEPGTEVPLTARPDGTWADAYDQSATDVAAAWHDPAATARTAQLPIGEVPGVVALGMHVVEVAVHGWDLARASGQPGDLDDAVCQVAWTQVQGVTDDLRGPDGPFGPAVEVPDDATPTDRLVAWLGRTP